MSILFIKKVMCILFIKKVMSIVIYKVDDMLVEEFS